MRIFKARIRRHTCGFLSAAPHHPAVSHRSELPWRNFQESSWPSLRKALRFSQDPLRVGFDHHAKPLQPGTTNIGLSLAQLQMRLWSPVFGSVMVFAVKRTSSVPRCTSISTGLERHSADRIKGPSKSTKQPAPARPYASTVDSSACLLCSAHAARQHLMNFAG